MNLLNKWIADYYIKKRVKIDYKENSIELEQKMNSLGSGFSLIFLEGKKDDFVSNIICALTGKYSHVVLNWNCENIFSRLNLEERDNLFIKLREYYNISPTMCLDLLRTNKIHNLIIASMDDTGANYKNLAVYQNRKMDIVKLNLTPEQEEKVIKLFFNKQIMNSKYDYTGLAFWWLCRLFDDERAFYCSELYYEQFKKLGIKICNEDEPSPTQEYKYLIKIEKINNLIKNKNK